MKSELFIKRVFCFVFITIIAFFCGTSVSAVDEYGNEETIPQAEPITNEPYSEPVTDEPYYEPETEPVTDEPYYEPETEPVTDEPYYEPATEEPYNEPETEAPTQTAYEAAVEEDTTQFQAPTLAKTISTKTYSTNYTAGIVSWLCVAIGVIVISIVLISTKAGGKSKEYVNHR